MSNSLIELTEHEKGLVAMFTNAKSAAKADARSGHPGRRASGKNAVAALTVKIREVYQKAALR